MIVIQGDNQSNSALKSSLCDGENRSSLWLASSPGSCVGEHLRLPSGDGRTAAFKSDLSILASEIMGLFATSSPTKSEVERVLGRYMKHEGDFAVPEQRSISGTKRKSDNQINYTWSKDLQLRILDKISVPIFTKEPIKGENGGPLKVALVGNHSGEVVTYGPEASARVKIVVLEADVDGCLGEFKSKIVTKEGKGQFLTGNVVVHLNKGIGYIGSIYFPQTSIWKTKHEYRLGVMVEDASIETKIREGITESFYVKDRRLLLEKKHYPPKSSSEVWRLKGIARGGPFHQRLTKFDINTVGDFLKELNTSPQKLQDILGGSVSLQLWNGLVAHAHTCIPDERLQLSSSSRSQQKTNELLDKTAELEVIKTQNTQLCHKSVLERMIERAVKEELESASVKRRRRGKKIQSTEETVSDSTDNSSLIQSCTSMLGESFDNFDGIGVREVESKAFIVGDLHGESRRKHHPLSLYDEVWKLENVGKGGAIHEHLCREKVNTVKDFLTLLFLDPARLINYLGAYMSVEMCEDTIEHARSCVFEPSLYFYYPSASQQIIGVAFNIVGQVFGLSLNFHHTPADKLSEAEKEKARNMVIDAFRNWEEVVTSDNNASPLTGSSHLFSNDLFPNPAKLNYQQTKARSPDTVPLTDTTGDIFISNQAKFHDVDNMDIGAVFYDFTIGDFCEDEHFRFFGADHAL